MALPQDLSPKLLVEKPALLLHSQYFENPVTHLDGLVGGVTSDGEHIITSPNCSTILGPLLEGDRSLFLRDNLRYGEDDPIQWPQAYLPQYRHFACIARGPKPYPDAMNILWWTPDRRDFVSENDVLHGVGKLERSYYLQLRELSVGLLERAEKPLFQGKIVAHELSKILLNFLHRLETLSSSFFIMQRGVRELQRTFLQLKGFLDFEERYRLETGTPAAALDLMGAFTWDPIVCQNLFRAGVPVWLIRPYSALRSIRVRKLVPVTRAQGLLSLAPCSRPNCPTLYRGPGDRIEKYLALQASVLDLLKFPNPFGLSCTKPVVPPPPLAVLSKRQERSKRYSPYAHKGKQKQPAGLAADKFVDPVDPVFPPAIVSWKNALEEHDSGTAQFVYEPDPNDIGYTFPEPAMFVRAQSSSRRDMYFEAWLKYRSAFVYRVSSNNFECHPIPTSIWRDILIVDRSSNPPLVEDAQETKQTFSGQQHRRAREIFDECVKSDGVEFTGFDQGRMIWNNQETETITDAIREEVLWELSELNFRFELLALDSRASTAKGDRQALVADCFPGCSSGSLLVADLATANHGLADVDWEKRSFYLHALKRLMMSWPNAPSILRVERFQWKDKDIDELERHICRFYVESFYNHFRRAPIIPRRLSHTVAQYHYPILSEITILDPRPNTFYDVSILLPL